MPDEKQLIENLEYANKNLKKQVLDLVEELKNNQRAKQSRKVTVSKEVANSIHQVFASFDKNFYLEENPDVASSGINPYQHFMEFGFKEGRAFAPELNEKLLKVIFSAYNE